MAITRNTVLVLGAGASVTYGFPTGRKLLFDIAREIKQRGNLYKTLVDWRIGDDDLLKRFAEDLIISNQPSVDAFLEKREEFIELGKTAIALSLIPIEKYSNLRRTSEDMGLYEYIFQKMDITNKVSENKLSIVTYNYDRSLEFYLHQSLMGTYDYDRKEAALIMRHLDIIHVHGKLGEPDFISDNNSRGYDGVTNPDDMKVARDGIRIISEESKISMEVEKAKEIMLNAEVICFLGFGYHPDNIRRLFSGFREKDAIPPLERIYGSAYKLGAAGTYEANILIKGFIKVNITFGDQGQTAIDYLREYPILI